MYTYTNVEFLLMYALLLLSWGEELKNIANLCYRFVFPWMHNGSIHRTTTWEYDTAFKKLQAFTTPVLLWVFKYYFEIRSEVLHHLIVMGFLKYLYCPIIHTNFVLKADANSSNSHHIWEGLSFSYLTFVFKSTLFSLLF